ncbi:hypothetical protein NZ698_19275 [Chryseobacterium sp. PBS4-4]|uniref:Diacylglyceryl transferase n=1 Tax=Chryseobacterium edaphi TaxID=2976532 RepID=A0ABT2WBF4_9FLAO|nr:hypothetical protein [Chryseobacterium edaphi]MCU7619328.1 hypothetical protein [Chryseobacterium edaphi]
MSTIKKSLIISLVSTVIGAIQMAIFLPDGVSCLDGTSSLLDGILFFMPIQLVTVFIIGLVNKKVTDYFILAFLLIFWFFINKYEFTSRHACWSTFSDIEILKTVLLKSLLTCTICLFPIYFLMTKLGLGKVEKNLNKD